MIFRSQSYEFDNSIAATHVLIVACGSYPSINTLTAGSATPLSSPAISAHALADWFMEGRDACPDGPRTSSFTSFYNPSAPLGSLEMLTSPANPYHAPDGTVHTVSLSTFTAVKQAYREWIERLGNNPCSRGIFYFCGHGIGDGSLQTLLTDDVGSGGSLDKFYGSFNLSKTYDATVRATSAPVLLLIDACFEFSRQLVLEISDPASLISTDRSKVPNASSYLMRAAGTNRLAYAIEGEVSRFTSSLLLALRGHCGRQKAGSVHHEVVPADVYEATSLFLDRTNIDGAPIAELGEPQGSGFREVFHVLEQRPNVLIELDVSPPSFRQDAYGFVESHQNGRLQAGMNGKPWQKVVERGTYDYGAGHPSTLEKLHTNQLISCAVYTHCVQLDEP